MSPPDTGSSGGERRRAPGARRRGGVGSAAATAAARRPQARTVAHQPAALPRLAFVFRPNSFSPWELTAAARGACELIWVVDSTIPERARWRASCAAPGG